MSKRARITLDLEPEAQKEETAATAEEVAESSRKPKARAGDSAKANATPSPATESDPASILSAINIGAALKIAAVGLALISAVLLLKRKP